MPPPLCSRCYRFVHPLSIYYGSLCSQTSDARRRSMIVFFSREGVDEG